MNRSFVLLQSAVVADPCCCLNVLCVSLARWTCCCLDVSFFGGTVACNLLLCGYRGVSSLAGACGQVYKHRLMQICYSICIMYGRLTSQPNARVHRQMSALHCIHRCLTHSMTVLFTLNVSCAPLSAGLGRTARKAALSPALNRRPPRRLQTQRNLTTLCHGSSMPCHYNQLRIIMYIHQPTLLLMLPPLHNLRTPPPASPLSIILHQVKTLHRLQSH